MIALPRCPDPDQLRLYLLARLGAEDAAMLEEHFSWCDRCAESVDHLAESDVLTAAIRQRATAVAGFEPDVVEALVERLRCHLPLSFESRSDSGTTAWNTSSSAVDAEQSTEVEQEVMAFLAPAEAPDELGRLGSYRVLALVGMGGMGVVFRAEDPHLKRVVALKAMKRSLSASDLARKRFLREAQTLAALEHDHVVTIHQAGEDRGILYLAMPLLKGESLEERLRREERLPVADALRIAREAALGLAAAHAQGLVHRDVKPPNIWLEAERGRVKLLDFGLARPMDDAANLTQTGAIAGTPHYMSPEQTRGQAVTSRSDLFSLGAVFYQMLTGRPPFRGTDTVNILLCVATETPAPPNRLNPEVPRAVSDLALRLLAKAPEDRPESALAVAETIATIERDLAAPPPRRGRRAILATAAAALVALAALVITIRTDEGTLVLTVNEADVNVAVDGSRKIAITSPRDAIAVRLAPGQHSLIVTKDGFETVTRAFHVVRGGKEELNVRLEPHAAGNRDVSGIPATAPGGSSSAAPLADEPRPFVLRRAKSPSRESFPHLAVALAASEEGDAIEVHGNGPFLVPPIRLSGGHGLNLRAAPGYRPRFVATEESRQSGRWFVVRDAPLRIEGCDFQFRGNAYALVFQGINSHMEILNCRFQTFFNGGSGGIECRGGKLRIADCMIANGQVEVNGFGGIEAEVSNNLIFFSGTNPAIQVILNERVHLRMKRNTVLAPGGVLEVDRVPDGPRRKGIVVEATENLFGTGRFVARVLKAGPLARVKDTLSWHGRDNLYVGHGWDEPFLSAIEGDKVESLRKGLAAWKDVWGNDETGGREAPDVSFHWSEMYESRPEVAVAMLRREIEQARKTSHLDQLGPDWDLVGSGDAYVRAMAAAGRVVPKDRLRREPDEGGPFVVVREGRADRGHFSIAQALEAAADGDVIEVLSDTPLDGIEFRAPPDHRKTLTVRAGPGYQPVLRGTISLGERAEVAFEGIHFHEAALMGWGGRVARFVNCSVTGRLGTTTSSRGYHLHVPAASGRPLEIVNCLFYSTTGGRSVIDTIQENGPGAAGCIDLHHDGRISIRNSVVGRLSLSMDKDGAPAVSMDHCVVWDPGFVSHALTVTGPGTRTGSFAARDTLFEVAGCGGLLRLNLPEARVNLVPWDGARNVYRTGGVNWLMVGRLHQDNERFLFDLDTWRKHWGTKEEGSIIADPSTFDPAQWQLLPGSPGSRAARDGADLGADASRIGRVAEAPSAASAGAEAAKRSDHR